MLEEGSKRLNESQRIALDTESQGNDILLNLRTQREQIENSRSTVCFRKYYENVV
jgi:vesicle transport through interaction with t-SNAREs protein 1